MLLNIPTRFEKNLAGNPVTKTYSSTTRPARFSKPCRSYNTTKLLIPKNPIVAFLTPIGAASFFSRPDRFLKPVRSRKKDIADSGTMFPDKPFVPVPK